MTASMLFGPCSSKSRLFGPEALLKTPSVRAGVPLQDELGGRELAIVSAAEVAAAIWPGDSVDVPLMLAYTASFVHRLYMNASMLDWKPRDVGPVCLILAGKALGKAAYTEQVAQCVYNRQELSNRSRHAPGGPRHHPRPVPRHIIKRFLELETAVYEKLSFDLAASLPYIPFVSGVGRIINPGRSSDPSTISWCQVGWTFIRDSLFIPLVVLYPPSVIAAAVFVLSSAALKYRSVRESLDNLPDWGMHFGLDGHERGSSRTSFQDVKDCLGWIAHDWSTGLPGLEPCAMSPPWARPQEIVAQH